MLNGKKVSISVGGGDFPVIPSDKYTTQITDVNFKTKFNSFKNREEEGLNYEFTILDNKTMMVANEEGKEEPEAIRGRKLWRYFSPNDQGQMSLGDKSNLKKLVEAALGKSLTKEDKENFQPEDIIDLQVDVFVELVEGEGKNAGRQFNNITSFLRTTKQLTAFENDKAALGGEKTTQSVVATKAEPETAPESDPDEFIAGLEADQKKEAEAEEAAKAKA